ncbi:uncharacterized protein LOC131325934 isoform X2 [Rhododendron vialii]|uniref:uncharacterized protein LOC131325934 isoform X2 n=1 Tax=Rhododendron vialii TaxID=182163 RepID=UPI00265F8842|nr:uncharacterized protein LOC131325934 isoform X2 [Rhododendron vialii]
MKTEKNAMGNLVVSTELRKSTRCPKCASYIFPTSSEGGNYSWLSHKRCPKCASYIFPTSSEGGYYSRLSHTSPCLITMDSSVKEEDEDDKDMEMCMSFEHQISDLPDCEHSREDNRTPEEEVVMNDGIFVMVQE